MPVIKGDSVNPVIKLYKNERKKIREVAGIIKMIQAVKPMVVEFGRAANAMREFCEIFGIKETADERDQSGDGAAGTGHEGDADPAAGSD